MAKRTFDIISSLLGLLLLSPILLFVILAVVVDSKGGAFYKQVRVGMAGKDFGLLKFRTMRVDADKLGLLTVGGRDPRITKVGYFLRRYKLDELPQLFNILTGDMSVVGPRPEVRKYVEMYSDEQMKVLEVRPGLTDFASIEYVNENEVLARSENPEETYIQEIMPHKLQLNQKYIQEKSFLTDIQIIFSTIKKILR